MTMTGMSIYKVGDSIVQLYNGDCLEVMDRLISEGIKVDLTVTSPPYDDLRTYDNTLNWNFDIFKQIANKLYQITADGGVVVWVVGDKTKKGNESGTSFKQALYFKEIGFNLHDTMIYAKANPFPLTHRRYEQQFEYMFVLSKGKPKTFNPIMKENKHKGKFKTGTHRTDGNELKPMHKLERVSDKSIDNNIWYYNIGKNQSTKDAVAHKHPAIFPEQLVNDHIISWCNPGDIVFDPLMGSGTTGVVSHNLDRNFIGIEKVEKYFNIAKERINNILGGENNG